jgi:hypothetical protein
MQQHPGLAFAVAVAILGVFTGGGAGCSVLLDTDTNPYKCTTDADCARYASNAACDSARKQCVTRLPPFNPDAGVPDGGGGMGGLSCTLSFDNRLRVPLDGPDGGLRPLPVVP